VLALSHAGEPDAVTISFIWMNPHAGQTFLLSAGGNT
jgi:hypothetical protein